MASSLFNNDSVGSDQNVSNLSNITDSTIMLTEYYAVFVPIMCFMAICAFLVNIYVLLSMRWLRKPVSGNLTLSLSLAAADAYASFLIVLGLVGNSYLPVVHEYPLPPCPMLVLEVFRMGGLLTSVLHLLTLAFNHYFGIVYSLLSKRYMTKRVLHIAIALLWIAPPLPIFIHFSVKHNEAFRSIGCNSTHSFEQFTFRLTFGLTFVIPILVTSFFYVAILRHLRKRNRDPLLAQSLVAKRRFRTNRKLVITMILIMGSFLLGWLPSVSSFVLSCNEGCLFKLERGKLTFFISAIFYILVIVKLFLNALIYASRLIELRYAMWKMRQQLLPGLRRTEMPREFDVLFKSSVHSSSYRNSLINSQRLVQNKCLNITTTV